MITARPLTARRIVAQRIRGLLLGDTGAGGAAFSPLALFSDGEEGFYNDIQTYSTSYFTDTAGTDPAVLEDTIGLVLDQSGNDIDLTQATAGARPKLSARYNLLERTEEFDDAAWGKLKVTIAANSAVAPDGTTTADKLQEDSTVGEHFAFQQIAKAASNITYTQEVKFKNAAGTRNFGLGITDGLTGGYFAVFSTSGTVVSSNQGVGTTTGWTFVSSSVTPTNEDFYIAQITVTSNTSTRLDGVCYLLNGTSRSYTGDGTSGIYIWGADLRLASDTDQPAYQRVTTATAYDDVGFDPYLQFDQVDDALTATIPAITGGTLVLATRQGIWIDDDINASAGTFSIGPTTYTGGPVGLFSNTGSKLIGPPLLIDRQLTSSELNAQIQFYKSRGAGDVFLVDFGLIFDRAGSSILDRNDDPIRVRAA